MCSSSLAENTVSIFNKAIKHRDYSTLIANCLQYWFEYMYIYISRSQITTHLVFNPRLSPKPLSSRSRAIKLEDLTASSKRRKLVFWCRLSTCTTFSFRLTAIFYHVTTMWPTIRTMSLKQHNLITMFNCFVVWGSIEIQA